MENKKRIDSVAKVLFEAWAEQEPDHMITKFPLSYMATFADMARAVIKGEDEKHLFILLEIQGILADLEYTLEATTREEDFEADDRIRGGIVEGKRIYKAVKRVIDEQP